MTEHEIEALEGKPRDWLLLSETFLSHQGEGPSAGERSFFVRLGGCNLTCRWCDTPYTWVYTQRQADQHNQLEIYNPKRELQRVKIPILTDAILDSMCRLTVLTGGEPLLQVEQLAQLIRQVNDYHDPRRFEVETAGTLTALDLVDFENVTFNVSLKLATSGNDEGKRRVNDAIVFFQELSRKGRARFKFVVTDIEADLIEIEMLIREYDILPSTIWLMPQGTTHLSQISGAQLLMPVALHRGFNFSSRLHVLGYGNKRGI